MSGIKRIAVHVDGGAHDAAVLRLSAALAGRFGAGLEAIFANVPPFIPASIDGILTPQIIEAQQAIYRKRAEVAKKTLAAVTLPTGKPVWTEIDALATDAVVARARYADLTVLAQPAPDESDAATDYDLPANVVMSLGRPVLMVPYAGTFTDVGKRILVAWSGTRESARALADALPFLVGADQVTVLMVNPAGDAPRMEADLKTWFDAHGIRGKTRTTRSKEIGAGDALLSAAADISADLLVMGGYGHNRFREMLLGGVTQSMLSNGPIPVFMSA